MATSPGSEDQPVWPPRAKSRAYREGGRALWKRRGDRRERQIERAFGRVNQQRLYPQWLARYRERLARWLR
jgi:hypothetical protein